MDTKTKLFDFISLCQIPPIVVCIGSPSVPGDSFGPLTGQLLNDFYRIPSFVYGTLYSPITALNLRATLRAVKGRHPSRKIIAVDSAVGSRLSQSPRYFFGSIKPGLAAGKELPLVGDFSVTATLGVNSVKSLASVKFAEVYGLSLRAAEAISLAFGKFKSSFAATSLTL